MSGIMRSVNVVLLVLIAAAGVIQTAQAQGQSSRPPGFIAPPLDPTGVTLETRKVGEGVYALLSNTPFADNAGFIVGDDAVLVIDSHINREMGEQILKAVREVTDLPIAYLVNTNAFPDHTFGNGVFPETTKIVAHTKANAIMNATKLDEWRRRFTPTVGGNAKALEDVALRMPDIVFEDQWRIDLGGRVVEVYFFGPGMSPSDSVVYAPDAKVAWTGNLVFGEGTLPWANFAGVATYQKTLSSLTDQIDPQIIVPGHGRLTSGDIITRYKDYFSHIVATTEEVTASGVDTRAYIANATPPAETPIAGEVAALMTGFHRWNLQKVFVEIDR